MHSILPPLASWPWTALDLANHLWQSTVVAVAVLALITACGRLSAGTRRTLGWMALAKFALPVAWIASLLPGGWTAPSDWLVSGSLALPAKLSQAVFPQAGPAASEWPTVRLLLGAGWALGFGILFAFWLVHGVRLRRAILANSTPVAAALERPIAAAAARAGLRQPPVCLATESDCGPGVLGVLSPVVILPRGLEDSLTPAELESVLLHEASFESIRCPCAIRRRAAV